MNTFAWLALFSWPIAAIVFYRKLSLPWALCATVLGGYLLLPLGRGIDLPVLPPLNKATIPIFSALVLTHVYIRQGQAAGQVLRGWMPRNYIVVGLLLMLAVGIIGSITTNGDTLVYGARVIDGVRLYDGFSYMLSLGVMLIPLFLGRRVLSSADGQRTLLLAIAGFALVYTLPILWEVRMSPQLHTQFYGFFPSSFAQNVRDGGFRPVVFMGHGLLVAIFVAYAILASIGLFRSSKADDRAKWALAAGWLFINLVLVKTLGALLITIVLVPIALFFTPRLQILAAACIAGMIMIYPIMRAADVVPVDGIMSFAASINEERAASFNTRIESEELLLEKARERPLFGWGGWGRNRVFDDRGRDLALTDGSWIIELGTGGWFRYIPIFGLLCLPIISLFLFKQNSIDVVCAVLALILCAKLVDLIPNSGFPALNWLMAGALWGRLEMKAASFEQPAEAAEPVAQTRGTVYARDLKKPPATEPERGVRYARDLPKRTPAKGPAKVPRQHVPYTRAKPSPGGRK